MVIETRRRTRVWIPHPKEDGVKLAGDLEHGERVEVPEGEITNKRGRGLVLVSDCAKHLKIMGSLTPELIDTTWDYGVRIPE
jgi:hypothetical protein